MERQFFQNQGQNGGRGFQNGPHGGGHQRQQYQHNNYRQNDRGGNGPGGMRSLGDRGAQNMGGGAAGNGPGGQGGPGGPGGPAKKTKRTVTDYGSTMTRLVQNRRSRIALSVCGNRRMAALGGTIREFERPSPSYIVDMEMPISRARASGGPTGRLSGVDAIPAKHVHVSVNRERHVIYVVLWTPEGRRLLTASLAGEFTLWNGIGFNYESISQAHSASIRAAKYSNNDDWLLSGDNDGFVKYWQSNFNNIKIIRAHPEPIRGIAFAPTDTKFVTASEDAKLKVFDFANGEEETTLSGHSWELRSVDWHPTKGLIVSGSKDATAKLWDPRTGTKCLTTLKGHKGQVAATVFERTGGQLLATGSRDQMVRIFDLRMMRDVFVLRGNEREITSLTWHPLHRNLVSTGANDGSIRHYLLDEPNVPEGAASVLSPYDVTSPEFAANRGGFGGGQARQQQQSAAAAPAPSQRSVGPAGPYIPSIIDHPPQTIYPAHSVGVAHETAAVWSLAWHPAGHLLVSGGQDRMTRFWTRPRPGDSNYLADRYHIGQANAEAHAAALARRKEALAAAARPAGHDEDGTQLTGQEGHAAFGGIGAPGAGGGVLPGIGNQAPAPDRADEWDEESGLAEAQSRLPGLSVSGAATAGMHQHHQQHPGMAPSGAGGMPGFPAGPGGVPQITAEMAQQLLTLPPEMLEQLPEPVLAQIRNLGRTGGR